MRCATRIWKEGPSIDKEVWKPIVYEGYDFTGKYEISNHGRVKSVDRYAANGRHVKERILKLIKSEDGYNTVNLVDKTNNISVYPRIARLVGYMFVENPKPDEYNVINHKDEVRHNDYYENLEWCTVEYNNNYGHHIKRGSENGMAKAVICKTTGKAFGSIAEASRYYEIKPGHLYACLNPKDRQKTTESNIGIRLEWEFI